MIKQLLWIFLVTFLASACKQSAPTLLQTPSATFTPTPTTPPLTPTPILTPTCYITTEMTSTAIYPLALTPIPNGTVYYPGQVVETAVTGGFLKWYEVEICGEERTYVDDIEREITILLADQTVVEFVCVEETCPVTFTIPSQMPTGLAELMVQSSFGSEEYIVVIESPETPTP